MVYVKAWTEFQSQAEALYLASPSKTRYVVKYRAVDGKLVLKVTDDATTLSFKTAHSVYLGRFEALTLSLTQKMQNYRPPAPIIAPMPAVKTASLAPTAGVSTPAGGSRSGTPMPEDASGGGVGASGTASGGTKKKPKKKKK